MASADLPYSHVVAQGELRPEEMRAADVVRRLLLAHNFEPRDIGGRTGMYDLDIIRDGDVVASVEVTLLADEAIRRTWNEKTLARHRRASSLQHGWLVTFSQIEDVKLNDVMPEVHAQLIVLETDGIRSLDVFRSQEHHDSEHPSRLALKRLGLLSVEVEDGLAAGLIVLSSIGGGTRGWDELEDALEARAAAKADQLAKADAAVERILFAWIDTSRQDLLAQLDRWATKPFGPPPRTLSLPNVIDTVIVGALAEGNDRFYRWPGFSPFNSGTGESSSITGEEG